METALRKQGNFAKQTRSRTHRQGRKVTKSIPMPGLFNNSPRPSKKMPAGRHRLAGGTEKRTEFIPFTKMARETGRTNSRLYICSRLRETFTSINKCFRDIIRLVSRCMVLGWCAVFLDVLLSVKKALLGSLKAAPPTTSESAPLASLRRGAGPWQGSKRAESQKPSRSLYMSRISLLDSSESRHFHNLRFCFG